MEKVKWQKHKLAKIEWQKHKLAKKVKKSTAKKNVKTGQENNGKNGTIKTQSYKKAEKDTKMAIRLQKDLNKYRKIYERVKF